MCRLVCRRPQAAKPVLRRGSSRSAFPLWGKAVMAYPPTGSVQTECTRLPVMLRTKGRFLCQRTIGFVGLQKHINSGYAFAERQIAHNGKRGKGDTLPAWAKRLSYMKSKGAGNKAHLQPVTHFLVHIGIGIARVVFQRAGTKFRYVTLVVLQDRAQWRLCRRLPLRK